MEIGPQEYQAGFIIGSILISVGLALLASMIFKPKVPQPLVDDRPTTASQRGGFIPLVFGTRRLGPTIAWVGDRKVTEEPAGEVGGKKGDIKGGDGPMATIYHERGWHVLAIGCASRILGIYKDGKIIPGSDELTSNNHPSGTTVDFGPEYGSLRIYWGDDQPVDAFLADKIGVASRWPNVCYVIWDRVRLGLIARWPLLEYVVEVMPNAPPDDIEANLGGAAAFFGNPRREGVNPAYILWQIHTGSYPFGLNLPNTTLDGTKLAELAALAVTENISMNILAQDGVEALQLITAIMADFGFLLPDCCGVLAPNAIREITGEVPVLDNDLLLPPLDEIERLHTRLRHDSIIYTYKDRAQKYRTASIDIDDDSDFGIRNRRKVRKVAMPTITDRGVASRTVKRRQLEEIVPPVRISAKGTRALRSATPGQAFDLPGVGRVRLAALRPDFKSPAVDLDLIRDMFNSAPIDFTDPDLPVQDPVDLLDDLRWRPIELPYKIIPGAQKPITFSTVRVRADQSVAGGRQLTSPTGLSYNFAATQFFAAVGGVLAGDWDPPGTLGTIGPQGLGGGFVGGGTNVIVPDFAVNPARQVLIERGPIITIDDNGDIENLLNLSTDIFAWYAGRQLMVIGDELLFVREFVNITGNNWQARGVLRNRFDTFPRQRHQAGDEVFVTDALLQIPIISPLFVAGHLHFFKNQPFNANGSIDLALLTAKNLTILGKAINPMAIPWFAIGGSGRRDGKMYRGGSTPVDDLLIEWAFPHRIGEGAGETPYGSATIVPAAPEGSFEIRIWMVESGDLDNFVIIRTFANLTTVDSDGIMRQTYTRAQRLTDGTDDLASTDFFEPWYFDIRQTIDGKDGPLVITQVLDVSASDVPRSD